MTFPSSSRTDAELLLRLARREAEWQALLEPVQEFHRNQLGRTVLPVGWVGGNVLGRHSWFGFYWKPELFWFGFGLHEGHWCPLIEADRRAAESQVWETLSEAMPSVWRIGGGPGGLYLRLWAQPTALDDPGGTQAWFLQRSRELHEFAAA